MQVKSNAVMLDANELATAIDAYLAAHNLSVSGPRTVYIMCHGKRHIAQDCEAGVYVDPSGRVVDNRPDREGGP